MAGQKFEYDESGSTFFYFIISILGLILVPCTFIFLPSDPDEDGPKGKRKGGCKCPECQKKEERLKNQESNWQGTKKTIQRVLIFAGWVMMAALVYKVQQFDYEYANFDPYDILGVGMHASNAEIKKAYHKQSLIYHPDKSTGDERKFMKLSKAYQALTDPIARRNYEQYGNPDGPGAMHFGIALPSWIVEKENSLWVLGLYTLVFMIGLPTVVAIWWYRSSKFSADQVLLDTTQLYYYFYHRTPNMIYKRALMVLSSSFEFERGHNSAIVERPSDNYEVPSLFKQLPNLGEKNKERPLCFPYSIKARVLLHAHLSRIPLNPDSLDLDRLYLLHCCPTLIQEMVTCVAQLIMLAHAGRISRLPTLDTIEATMKLCPSIVQAIWDNKNPLLQLPHFTESTLRNCVVRGRTVRSIQQLVTVSPQDRRQMLKTLTAEEQLDVLQVCANFPHVTMTVHYEVVDDDDNNFTAGAIVTVTVRLVRENSGDVFPVLPEDEDKFMIGGGKKKNKHSDDEKPDEPPAPVVVLDKKQTKWSKNQKKKGGKGGKENAAKRRLVADKAKKDDSSRQDSQSEDKETTKTKDNSKRKKGEKSSERRRGEDNNNTDDEDSHSHSDESEAGDADTESHRDDKTDADEDAEWERFQKGITKREKVLEGQSKNSHSVHCPYFTDDKQEYWWVYVCDRKNRKLITVPYHVTNLVTEEEVQLKMTTPPKPGLYSFQVCLRSDCYLGLELTRDIKMDVKAAREVPTHHPQWQECSSEDEDDDDDDDAAGKGGGDESEFTTDDDDDTDYDSDEDNDD